MIRVYTKTIKNLTLNADFRWLEICDEVSTKNTVNGIKHFENLTEGDCG